MPVMPLSTQKYCCAAVDGCVTTTQTHIVNQSRTQESNQEHWESVLHAWGHCILYVWVEMSPPIGVVVLHGIDHMESLLVMAEMRHPHVVQFLGLCFLEGSTLPVLVMEKLDGSLDDLLESTPGLPLPLKQSLLVDVVRGLLYLHTRNPPVVHRDLSARNVLLTSSLVAKVSDLGNARIVNLQPGQLARTLTRLPGTSAYMPPETFDEHSQYGPRLDIFSFGHLALFTLTQVREGWGDSRWTVCV